MAVATQNSVCPGEQASAYVAPAAERVPPAAADEPRPRWLDRGRIPCLDGLRALSIALVFVEHISLIITRPALAAGREPTRLTWFFGNIGGVGVDVFFAISGFLITLLLVREVSARQTVNLKDFYVRRFLRLMPAAAVYIATVFVLQILGRVELSGRTWAHVLTYTVNFDPDPAWQVGHLWSLSIEEQFYFLWPIALVLLGTRRAGLLAALWLVGAPVLRFVMLRTYPLEMGDFEYWTPLRVDSIAAGCLLALVAHDARFRRHTNVNGRLAMLLLGGAALAIFGAYVVGHEVALLRVTVGRSVRAAGIVAVIWLSINHADSAWGRVLDWKPLVTVGILSYSLYLWQQLFLRPESGAGLLAIATNVVLAVAAAVASYLLIERPFLRLKDRVAKRTVQSYQK